MPAEMGHERGTFSAIPADTQTILARNARLNRTQSALKERRLDYVQNAETGVTMIEIAR